MPADSSANPYAAPAFHPESASVRPGAYAFAKDPRRLSRFLVRSLVVYLVVEMLCNIWYFIPFGSAERSYGDAELDMISAINTTLFIIHPAAVFVTVITFGWWIYRAGVNSRGFGARGMRVSPAGAIGWYFVPIMNFFRPYQAMKEIWQVSGNPADWRNEKGSPILFGWWTLCVVVNVHGFIGARVPFDFVDYLNFLQYSIPGAILAMGTHAAITVMAILLVRAIARRQEALVARGGE